MRNQLSEDDSMHNFGVIPVARLNHKPINFKKVKKTNDGCYEYKTKIEFKDNSILFAVYHQWIEDVDECLNLHDLSWRPSWYEYMYDNNRKTNEQIIRRSKTMDK